VVDLGHSDKPVTITAKKNRENISVEYFYYFCRQRFDSNGHSAIEPSKREIRGRFVTAYDDCVHRKLK
jgi:hypothetical protein